MTWNRFKFIDLFAGIGGIRIPFDKFNGKCVFTSEIDPHCQDVYEANFGERPHGDITKIAPQDVPDHDILLGGFPVRLSVLSAGKKVLPIRAAPCSLTSKKFLRKSSPALSCWKT